MDDLTAFGPDFVWGTATSSYQIEGAVGADGRAPSIWDTFCRKPGAIDNGDTGDTACDHYNRWQEDIRLMQRLSTQAYRFSIAWPRVVPGGDGPVNRAGLDFYDRLVDGLLEAGITPYATLYHWDLPQTLQDRGGWPSRETAEHFAEYARVAAEALGDRVTDWATLNEPLCSAWIGHLQGSMAPGVSDLTAAVRASFHLHLGHGLAVQAIRAAAPSTPSVGIVNNLSPCDPVSDREEDAAAARRADGHINRWWLDPIHGRGYPQDMLDLYQVDLPARDGDLETIAAPLDWLGVNYYFRAVVEGLAEGDPLPEDPEGALLRGRMVQPDGARQTAMGWEVHPAGLEELLVRVARDYSPQRIMVTESGSAYRDTVGPDGQVDDPERTAYLEEHLSACAAAVRRGVPLGGYFAWSLLDNFEWAYGYDKRFGLVYVDYETQQRTIKGSGRRYADIINSHRSRVHKAA